MNNSLLLQDTFQWNNWTIPISYLNNTTLIELLMNTTESNNDLNQYLNDSLKNFSDFMLNIDADDIYELFSKNEIRSRRDALSLVTTITVFYALIFIAGVLGNLITCIVISRNKFMHTATNFYLFNLAISDMILLISGMPPDLFNIWYPLSYPFTDPVCILESILCETSANATVLTITAFTVERYIAICHPFRQHTMSKLSRAIKFILAIWFTAFILAMPQAMQFGVIDERGGKLCSVKNNYIGHVFAVSGFVFFVGPMTAICVLYVLIGVKLKKSKLLHSVKRKGCDINNRGISAQTRVIRMLIAVAVAFFFCWAPFHAQRLMAVYGSTVKTTSILFDDIYTVLTYTSGVLYFLSTCINPLLYNIMSYKFRDAFKVTLARQFGLVGNYQIQNHNYSALLARQNGSIRLTAVTNRGNNYSLGELQQRESDLSLQDGLRTNRSHRFRCVSVSSQSTLLTTISKNDVFATNSGTITPSGLNGGGGTIGGNVSKLANGSETSPIMRNGEYMSTIDDNSISDSQRIQEIPLLRKQRNSISVLSKESKSNNNVCNNIEKHSNYNSSRNNSSDNEATTSLSSNSRNNSNRSLRILSITNQKYYNRNKCQDNNVTTPPPPPLNKTKNKNGCFTTKNTNDLKLSALENLSQKLRYGTRKVFLRRNNPTGFSGITPTMTASSPTNTKYNQSNNSKLIQNKSERIEVNVKSINVDVR